MRYSRVFAVTLLAVAGCNDVIDLDPLDETPPVEASVRPAPIIGGTLTVTDDGTAVAADPDRDIVHVVDIAARSVRHTIALEAGDQPGRVALGSDGLAHVVLRGFGGVATIDHDAGTVVARRWLCPEPRGIAFDAGDSTLHVACAGGTLFHMSESGEELDRQTLEPDLRDVFIVDGTVHVSLFRSAAIVGVDGTRLEIPTQGGFEPHVAWRTWVDELGAIRMIHQMESTEPVPIDPSPEDVAVSGSAPYGGGFPCEPGIVAVALSTIVEGTVSTTTILDSRLTVDAALSPGGELLAMAVPGVEGDRDSFRVEVPNESSCFFEEFEARPDDDDDDDDEPPKEQVVSVAWDDGGLLIMQSREPARLLITDNAQFGVGADVIELEGESRFDSGHEIFHRATESGLSCASCHPEGTDDGHVWRFDSLGKRRTQPLDVGLIDTAPYHWDGDMADLDTLMSEVLAHRMGGKRQSPERSESFARWVFDLQRPPADDGQGDLELVRAGEELFATYKCTQCHDGPALGGDKTERVRGVEKQVPSLRRISLHQPYMHDGRSLTLDAAVRDMIESTLATSAPEEDIDAITAYLRTL